MPRSFGAAGHRPLDALGQDAAAAWLWRVPAVEILNRICHRNVRMIACRGTRMPWTGVMEHGRMKPL
jgi:hypothetical protein